MSFLWKVAQSLEIRWWQRYLRKKPVAEYLDWKKNYWRTFLERTRVSIPDGGQVLDAGCGPAGIFIITGSNPTDAVDPLLDQYQQELQHFDRAWYPATRFFAVPLEKFFAPRKYDLIFCLNAINHVADIHKSIEILAGCLAPEGTLIMSIDAHKYKIIKWLFRLGKGDALHPHQYSLPDYILLTESKGMKVTESILYDDGFIFQYYVLKIIKKK